MSGSGSAREYIQRLGRILRPSKGKRKLCCTNLFERDWRGEHGKEEKKCCQKNCLT